MARRKSPIELVAYTVAVAGPLALYLAHRGREPTPPPVLDMAELSAAAVVDRTAPVIPVVEPPATVPPVGQRAGVGAELPFALVSNGRLLLERDVPRAWGTGPVRAGEGPPPEGWMEDYLYGEKTADLEAIPAAHADLLGRRVDLYGSAGKVCEVEVTALNVVAEINGHAYYMFDDVETDEEGKVTPEQGRALRRKTYQQTERWLMAELRATAGDCDGALFGRGAVLPAPAMLTPRRGTVARKVKDDFLAEAAAQFRGSYELLSENTASSGGDQWPAWDRFVRQTYARTVYVDGAGRPVAAFQVVGDTESTCGDGFGEAHSALTRLGTARRPPPALPEFSAWTAPAVFVDADGNGAFEIIGGDYETAYYDDRGTFVGTATRPYEGCPC